MEIKDFQIVIDLKDLYTDCGECSYGRDGSFNVNEVLKSEIEHKVVSQIIRGFTPEVTKHLKDETIKKFEETFGEKINERIVKAIDRGVFVDKDGNTFNVNTIVKDRFEAQLSGSQHFLKAIDTNIKEQIAEMQEALQDRYDLEFASGIIKNMKDADLLKEGAEKLLLNKE